MDTNEPAPRRRGRRWLLGILVTSVLAIAVYTQLTIFVVPPMGAMPEGRTVIILRLNKTEFIDSPDAMCERVEGGVSLLCRAMAIGAVGNNMTVIARLPYSQTLYLISTNGATYER